MTIHGVVQLGQDAQSVAASSDASFHYGLHVEPSADFANIRELTLELESGRARDHFQAADSRKSVTQLIGQPVTEEFILPQGAAVHEGQYGDTKSLSIPKNHVRKRS